MMSEWREGSRHGSVSKVGGDGFAAPSRGGAVAVVA